MTSPMTAAEYSESVRQWLVQAYQWQAITYCKLFFVFNLSEIEVSDIFDRPFSSKFRALFIVGAWGAQAPPVFLDLLCKY